MDRVTVRLPPATIRILAEVAQIDEERVADVAERVLREWARKHPLTRDADE